MPAKDPPRGGGNTGGPVSLGGSSGPQGGAGGQSEGGSAIDN